MGSLVLTAQWETPGDTARLCQSVMSGMFQVCQGTCLCAPSPEGYGKGKVLYCYGEVVLQRANLRTGGEEEEKEVDQNMFHLQLSQLVGVAVLLFAILLVLISIRRSISKLHHQIKKVVKMMMMSPLPSRQNTLEKKHAETMNGHCLKFDKEVLRKPERDNIGLSLPAHYPMDTISVNSEIA